jgi:DNA-binding phage protein
LIYRSIVDSLELMSQSTLELKRLLDSLTVSARKNGLNDAAWASAAGFSKETLSRLRRRSSCDLSTLVALADATGARLSVTIGAEPATTPDGHFPRELSRDYEHRLLTLCASRKLDLGEWTATGPAFFMAGLAVMLAGNADADRRGLLALAESLHPGATEVLVFARWLKRSPLRPSRFLPMLAMETKHAA